MVVEAQVGKSILEVAQENEIDLEGACDGSMACSTCHVVFEQKHFDVLPKPEEEEEDMLDLAFGLTDTSRLGCQIKVRARHTQTARTPRSRADPNPRRCRPAPVAGRTVARRHEAHHPGLRLRRGGARKQRAGGEGARRAQHSAKGQYHFHDRGFGGFASRPRSPRYI